MKRHSVTLELVDPRARSDQPSQYTITKGDELTIMYPLELSGHFRGKIDCVVRLRCVKVK